LLAGFSDGEENELSLIVWSCRYNTHGHKLCFPPSKKVQFVTECGISTYARPIIDKVTGASIAFAGFIIGYSRSTMPAISYRYRTRTSYNTHGQKLRFPSSKKGATFDRVRYKTLS
jgi:hypothetical protein